MSGLAMSRGRVVVLAILSGVCISIVGVMYKLGPMCSKPVQAMQVIVMVSAVGFVYFLASLLRRPAGQRMVRGPGSRGVWIAGSIAGVGQVGLALLFSYSFARVPLTPIWCAQALTFVLVIVYARVLFRERMDWAKLLSLVAAGGCIAASALNGPPSDPATVESAAATEPVGGLLMAGLLVGIILCNAGTQLSMKELGMRQVGGQSLMQRGRDLYMVLLYGCLTAGTAVYCVIYGLPITWVSLGLGLAAAVGSISGISLLAACVSAPAAVVFTLGGVAGILSASLISVLFLGEDANTLWIATMALAAAAIVLGSGIIGTRTVKQNPNDETRIPKQ